ncbi:MAG: efflux RND transporter periplasmic adaptor subunit [Flavobacteriaceae bacterium]|nr:efflux RND transporter periplasmic adaptor subunit [Flavobacteriaceae bacterium]
MNTIRYTIAILFTSIFIVSCGSDVDKTVSEQKIPVTVTLSSNTQKNASPFITTSGKIEASNNANLSTRMMGFVNKIHVTVGDEVEKGQLLISINNSDLQAKLAQANASITQAKARFSIAKKDYNRFKNLFEDNSASQKEMDDMTSNYEMAKARLEAAQQMKNEVNAQFAYVNIRAPFKGVITQKLIKEGDMANPGVPLLSIENPSNFEVITSLNENEIQQIKKDVPVSIKIKSSGKIIKGKVSEISRSAQNTGGQYQVKINLSKTIENILSGMYVSVEFPVEKTNTSNDKVLVSTGALVHKGQLSGVYTVSENNTALLRWLRLGKTYGDQVEVLSGLNSDEAYILNSEGKLYNGAPINIKK